MVTFTAFARLLTPRRIIRASNPDLWQRPTVRESSEERGRKLIEDSGRTVFKSACAQR